MNQSEIKLLLLLVIALPMAGCGTVHRKEVVIRIASPDPNEQRSFDESSARSEPAKTRVRSKTNLPAEFWSYDDVLICKIEKKFDEETAKLGKSASGKVKIEFYLHSNGHVSRLRVTESDFPGFYMQQLICERIIVDSAPFDPWPSEMQQMVGTTYRRVEFNFVFGEPNKTK